MAARVFMRALLRRRGGGVAGGVPLLARRLGSVPVGVQSLPVNDVRAGEEWHRFGSRLDMSTI